MGSLFREEFLPGVPYRSYLFRGFSFQGTGYKVQGSVFLGYIKKRKSIEKGIRRKGVLAQERDTSFLCKAQKQSAVNLYKKLFYSFCVTNNLLCFLLPFCQSMPLVGFEPTRISS